MNRKEYMKEYRLKNKDRLKEYRFKNKDINDEYAREYHLKNKDKVNERHRKNHYINKDKIRVKKYNITTEQLLTMYEEQGNCCKICGIHKDDAPRGLVIDHDHKTGEVRGLLCNEDNLMLGLIKDDPERLEKGKQYLKTNGKFN